MAEEEEVQEEVQEEPGSEAPEEEHDDEVREVASTMVAAIGFNRESGELLVEFVNGRSESYPCDPSQWEEVKRAPSVGQWMHQNMLER